MDGIVVVAVRVLAIRGNTVKWWTIWRGTTGNTVCGWTAMRAGHSMSMERSYIIGTVHCYLYIEGVSLRMSRCECLIESVHLLVI